MKRRLSEGHEIISDKDESIRLFQTNIMDFLSRVAWFIPPMIFVPVVFYFAYSSFAHYHFNIFSFLGIYLSGLFLWSFTEYLFHRFIFHYYPKNKLGRKLHFLLHGVHHAYPNDSMRLVLPPAMSVPIAVVFYFVLKIIFGGYIAPIFAGFVSGYLLYDMLHYATHHAKFMKASWFVKIKNHHMQHHYKDPDHGFGVSSTFWDKVFGTEIK